MDWIWYAADSPSKHNQVSTFHDINHQSLTGNDNLDFLIILGIVLLPVTFAAYTIKENKENQHD
jgi:hypothetical protein